MVCRLAAFHVPKGLTSCSEHQHDMRTQAEATAHKPRPQSLSQTQALTAGVYPETLKASAPSQRLLSLPRHSSLHTHPPHRICPAAGRRHQEESRLVPAMQPGEEHTVNNERHPTCYPHTGTSPSQVFIKGGPSLEAWVRLSGYHHEDDPAISE